MNKIVIANLKMNLDYDEIKEYMKVMGSHSFEHLDLLIAPTSIYLDLLKDYKYPVVAQNLYCQDSGSFTGEISPKQLKSLGIHYAIVGHSERRNIFFENDMLVCQKVKACLKNNIVPILCIGERLEEQERADIVITEQLTRNLDGIPDCKDLIISYEPVWAIGTGLIPNDNDIKDRVQLIKDLMRQKYQKDVFVLYGGSVNKENCKSIMNIDDIDGVLVGSSSKDPIYFKEMLSNL